jgi:lipopolysaccharide/colanic/teichoic acid biosynthesis glycosyltransferase
MGMISSVISLAMVLMVAVLSKLAADDLKAWQPRITRRLIEFAVHRLPEDQRERYMEEWTAFIDETPGDLSKMFRAICLSWAARSITRIADSSGALDLGAKIADGVRRGFDLWSGLSVLILTCPLIVFSMIAIRLEGRGPIFDAQERVGKSGKVFHYLKLRTKSIDGDVVTSLGRFLRWTRIDELPQLINILSGEMALIGPRPERAVFVTMLSERIPGYLERFAVKPGLTGWAQINYPYGASLDDARQKLLLDLYYIENRSRWFDFRILIMTIWIILWREGP